MKVTVNIKTCIDCKWMSHSGSFTVRGARIICSHHNACGKIRVSHAKFKEEYPEYKSECYSEHWKFHWIHRCIQEDDKGKLIIPDWCPLKNGLKY